MGVTEAHRSGKFAEDQEPGSWIPPDIGEEIRRLREETDVVKKGLKQTEVYLEAIDEETKTLKEKMGAVEEEIKTLKEKVGETETETLKQKVGAIEVQTENLKENVGAIEGETETLKGKVGETETLKGKVGTVEEQTKTLKEKVGETETLKENVRTVEETKTLKEKVGEVEEETKTLKEKVGAVEEETKNLKKNVGEVEEETKALKETVGAIKQEDTETLKKNVGAVEEEIRALREKVVEIKQEEKRVAQKIEVLKVDAHTAQHNSFLDRKAKFDHEGDEKLRTYFQGIIALETLIAVSCTMIQHSADLGKFHGWIITLTVAMGLMIFLVLSINLLIWIYDFISQGKNLKTEKKRLESYFRAVKERNGDIEAGTLDDEHAAEMAQDNADSLKEMPVRVMPSVCAAVVILVVAVFCFIGQLIFVGKFFNLF